MTSNAAIEEVGEMEIDNNVQQGEAMSKHGTEGETGHVEQKEENQMPTPEQEEAVIKKKYGGIIPKKKPLISKDHERAFFDSADWALGKQGAQKPKGPLEALRPKLQPTHSQQLRSRRSAYAPSDDEAEDEKNDTTPEAEKNGTTTPEKNGTITAEAEKNGTTAPEDQTK